MPLFKMVNTVTLDWGLIPNQLLTPTGLQPFYYQRQLWSKQLCIFVNVSLCCRRCSEQLPTCLCVTLAATKLFVSDQRQRAVCSWLFRYDLSLSVSTSRTVHWHSMTLNVAETLGRVTELVEAPTLFLFLVDEKSSVNLISVGDLCKISSV